MKTRYSSGWEDVKLGMRATEWADLRHGRLTPLPRAATDKTFWRSEPNQIISRRVMVYDGVGCDAVAIFCGFAMQLF